MIPLRDDNPTQTIPFVTLGLLAANIVIFIYQSMLGPMGETFVKQYAAIPIQVLHWGSSGHSFPLPYTLFSAMFLHGNFLHLGGNMLFLWIFGNNIEDYLGHIRFILFYLICGLVSAFAHILTSQNSPIPMVGASGAISGVLGAYFLLYPRAGVETLVFFFYFIRIIRLPAGLFLGLWFLMQVLNAPMGGGVAWYAHIGGFVSGLVLISLASISKRKRRRRRFFSE